MPDEEVVFSVVYGANGEAELTFPTNTPLTDSEALVVATYLGLRHIADAIKSRKP